MNAPVNDFPRTALYRIYIYTNTVCYLGGSGGGGGCYGRDIRAEKRRDVGGYAVATAAVKKAERNLLRHNFFDTATAGTSVLRRVLSPRPYARMPPSSLSHTFAFAHHRKAVISLLTVIFYISLYISSWRIYVICILL